jgi:LCP family protein required for cell wall assembly
MPEKPSDHEASEPSEKLPPLPPELDPRGTTRSSRHIGAGVDRRRYFKQLSLYGTAIICTLLSIGLVVGTGVFWWNYRQFETSRETTVCTSCSGGTTTTSKHDVDGKDQNILIMGNDDRTNLTVAEATALRVGQDGGSLNTDTMMIIHLPADGKKATLISLPRDSYVEIPGYGMNKLNAAYPLAYSNTSGTHLQKVAAGANLLIQTVHNLTGLTIDHYAMVDLIGFYRISNAIGGIKVNMCQAISDPNVNAEGSGFKAHAGINIIQGTQALAFVRQRYNFPDGLGDLDRVKRQQYFLTATFRQAFSGNVFTKVNKLLGAVKTSVITDDKLNPLDLGAQMEKLAANNIASYTIPTDGFATTDVGSTVVVHPAAVQAAVLKWIGNTDPKLKTAPLVDPSTVSVSVLNAGTGQSGVAQTNADVLRSQGFQIGTVGDATSPVTATTIEYADGMQSQAKTLAQYVPGALLLKSSVTSLTLLLGPDGLKAKALPKPTNSPSTGTSSTPSSTTSTSSSPTPSMSTAPKAIDRACIN